MDAQHIVRLNVQRILNDRRISGAEFARALDHSVSWASNFLTGKKSAPIDTIEQMATYLQIPMARLFVPPVADGVGNMDGLTDAAGARMLPTETAGEDTDMPERVVAALFTLLPADEKEAVLADMKARVARSWGAALPGATTHPKGHAVR